MGGRHFQPTPNVRNRSMLAEAQEYAEVMRAFKRTLTRYEQHLLGESVGCEEPNLLAGSAAALSGRLAQAPAALSNTTADGA